MSIVVWDGKDLWADTEANFGEYKHTVSKLLRIGNYRIGYTGNTIAANRAASEFALHGTAHIPTDPDKNWYSLIVVNDSGSKPCVLYVSPNGVEDMSDQPYFAIGSGREFALGILAYNAYTFAYIDTRRIMETVCKVAVSCSMPIEKLEMADDIPF